MNEFAARHPQQQSGTPTWRANGLRHPHGPALGADDNVDFTLDQPQLCRTANGEYAVFTTSPHVRRLAWRAQQDGLGFRPTRWEHYVEGGRDVFYLVDGRAFEV